MGNNKVAIIQASFGGVDKTITNVEQSIPHDYFYITDEPLRLPPRLQAKIPKMFGWQIRPGYEYYLWLDGNLKLNHPDALKYFLEQIDGHDFVALRHPRRPNIRQEVRYLRKGLREQSIYLITRYKDELWKGQYEEIQRDKDFVDDLLLNGGIFMYRNTEAVRQAMKEWWYHVSRYNVQDQISLPYVLKKAGVRIKVLDHIYNEWEYLKHERHKIR